MAKGYLESAHLSVVSGFACSVFTYPWIHLSVVYLSGVHLSVVYLSEFTCPWIHFSVVYLSGIHLFEGSLVRTFVYYDIPC